MIENLTFLLGFFFFFYFILIYRFTPQEFFDCCQFFLEFLSIGFVCDGNNNWTIFISMNFWFYNNCAHWTAIFILDRLLRDNRIRFNLLRWIYVIFILDSWCLYTSSLFRRWFINYFNLTLIHRLIYFLFVIFFNDFLFKDIILRFLLVLTLRNFNFSF